MVSYFSLAAIFVTVFATSLISGVLGMAGGMILIAILVLLLPVPVAMILHGLIQAIANGSRFWLLRRHVVWHILPPYAVGVVATVALFTAFSFIAEPALVMIVVGSFPWIGLAIPKRVGLDITNRVTAAVCGVAVTASQLLAGSSGPLLDVFYQNTTLSRFQIVATKAFTQACSHVVKIVYFLSFVGLGTNQLSRLLPFWVIGIAIVLSIVATRLGTELLAKFDETRFRRVTNVVILMIGASIVGGGVTDILAQ